MNRSLLMSRKSIEPVSPRHIYVYDEDWSYLTERFGVRGFGQTRIGVGPAVRAIIHSWVKATRAREIARMSAAIDDTTQDNDDIEIEEPQNA